MNFAPRDQPKEEDNLVQKFLGLNLNTNQVKSQLNEANEIQRELESL